MSLRDELIQVAAVAMRWAHNLTDDSSGSWRATVSDMTTEVIDADSKWGAAMQGEDGHVWLAVLVEEVGEVAQALNETVIDGWRGVSDEGR